MSSLETVLLNKEVAPQSAIIRLDDESVAMVIRYTGSAAAATIEVEAGGDMLFKEDAAADVSIKLPSGGTGGTIDVSDAAADTLGEIVDHINGDPNWEAVLLDGLRKDSSNNTLLLLAATTAKVAAGLDINFDTSVALHISASIQNEGLPSLKKIDASRINRAFESVSKNTFASGNNTLEIWKAVGTVETLIWSQAAGATTVEFTKNWNDNIGIDGTLGGRLVGRIVGSVACTGFFSILGKSFNVEPEVGSDLGFS